MPCKAEPVSSATVRRIRDEFDNEPDLKGIDLKQFSSIFVSATKLSGKTEELEINFNSIETCSDLVKICYNEEELSNIRDIESDIVVYHDSKIVEKDKRLIDNLISVYFQGTP